MMNKEIKKLDPENNQGVSAYKKLGYKEIGRLERQAYWDGKFWDNIRMEKWLLNLVF